jgi:hypothetical protein
MQAARIQLAATVCRLRQPNPAKTTADHEGIAESMTRFTLNDRTYELESLPEPAKALIQKIRYAQSEITRIQVTIDHLNRMQCNAYEALCDMLKPTNPKTPPA